MTGGPGGTAGEGAADRAGSRPRLTAADAVGGVDAGHARSAARLPARRGPLRTAAARRGVRTGLALLATEVSARLPTRRAPAGAGGGVQADLARGAAGRPTNLGGWTADPSGARRPRRAAARPTDAGVRTAATGDASAARRAGHTSTARPGGDTAAPATLLAGSTAGCAAHLGVVATRPVDASRSRPADRRSATAGLGRRAGPPTENLPRRTCARRSGGIGTHLTRRTAGRATDLAAGTARRAAQAGRAG